jgi:G3E family GTPase
MRAINSTAKILHTRNADVAIETALQVGAFDLQPALAMDGEFLFAGSHDHGAADQHHDGEIGSVGIVDPCPLSRRRRARRSVFALRARYEVGEPSSMTAVGATGTR